MVPRGKAVPEARHSGPPEGQKPCRLEHQWFRRRTRGGKRRLTDYDRVCKTPFKNIYLQLPFFRASLGVGA